MNKQIDMRGIRPRGSSYHVSVQLNGERRTGTCASLPEAIALRDKLRDALETGKVIDTTARSNARVWSLQEALDKTLSLPAKDGWKGTSWERKGRINVEDAIRFFGTNFPVDKLDLHQMEKWIESLEAKGNSDGTINRKMSALRKVLSVAEKYGGLASMPRFPTNRKERKNRIRQISDDEEVQMLERFRLFGDEWMADIVAVLIDTGMRSSELLNVWKQDYTKGSKGRRDVVLIHGVDGKGTKNGEFRSVPLTKRSSAIFKRWVAEADGTVLLPYSYDELRNCWDKVRENMGLIHDESWTLHVCRHTCCSRLVRSGVPLTTVKMWMGHKDISTTMRYAHLYPSDLFTAVDALEAREKD